MAETFDALRADLWRTVARADLEEDELIQSLLERLGPGLGVSRACYNERHGPSGDLVTVAEWTAPGVKPTLGEHIPAMLLRPVEDLGEFEVTVEAYTEVLPRLLRPIARPILEAIFRSQDLSSVFIMLYRVDGRPEGALSLDLTRRHARPRGWSAEVRPLIADALQIVGLAVARHRAARSRDASELRYRSLVDRLADGVAIVDPDERVLLANPRAAEVFGVPPRRLVGRSLRDFVDDEAWAQLRAESSRRAQGESSTYELEVRRPDERTRRILVTCSPEHDGEGRYVGALGVFHDITDRERAAEERRALERRMLQAQKLESLGLLAGSVAHDFNNILTVIRGQAELARHHLPPQSPAVTRLDDILRATGRATDLARQMLAYAGRGDLTREPCDLSGLVVEMTQMLRVSLPKKARLALDCPAGLPAVAGDAGQIQQVVMNLVTNAAEALGEDGGTVRVRTGTRDCDAAFLARAEGGEPPRPGPYVFLEVDDTGRGMTAAERARIFEPFFTTKFTGRGLGLAALLGIVRAHHGAVIVDSEPGQGTRVTVALPAGEDDAVPREPQPPPPAPVVAAAGARATVLFVDDEADIRELAAETLAQAGYQVLVAADGVEAMLRFAECPERIACAIVDLTMPRRDGVETLEALRHLDPELPIILSSGYEGRALTLPDGAGGVEFLQKPYSPANLVALVRGHGRS